jgi:hypothetical protein
MILACTACSSALRVGGDPAEGRGLVGQESEFWPDRYPCFRCGGRAEAFAEPEVSPEALRALSIVNVTAEEAYAALLGLGTPEERAVSDELVEGLFRAHGARVRGRQIAGVLRYVVDFIELSCGTRIHFAPSPQGAVIYRVTKRHGYAARVLEEEGAR